jgi:hypothetical protein
MKRNDFFEKVWSWKVNPVNLVNLEILVSTGRPVGAVM